MARPQKQITVTPELLITEMAERQCPKTEIASALGISTDTFDRREGYAALYTKGRLAGKCNLRSKLISVALGGNVTALIFLGKSMLGLKETSAMELSGPDGNPLEVNTNDARTRLATILARSASRSGSAGVSGEPNG